MNFATVLCGLGYDWLELLPIKLDDPLPDETSPFVALGWIWQLDCQGEIRRGESTADEA